MPAIASAAGVQVDVVDSGAGDEFSRPEQAIQPHGPIANSLEGRMLGSSQAVDALGDAVTAAAEPVLDERVGNDAA
jgi:hypothetical protein